MNIFNVFDLDSLGDMVMAFMMELLETLMVEEGR